MQIYAPTSHTKEQEIATFYIKLVGPLEKLPRKKMSVELGDLVIPLVMHFCTENNLLITHTGFQQHTRSLYTWKSPGNEYRNQIDDILVKFDCEAEGNNVKTDPGVDCNTDHQFLLAELNMKLRLRKKTTT